MAAQVDTEQLINEDVESGEEQEVTDDDSEARREGDGNSDSNSEGGVHEDEPPPIGVYDHVAPDVDENKEKKGNLCQRGGKAVWACLIGCCHDCKTMDKVIFVFHILLIVAGLAVGTVTTLSKMSTHNQCYLKAHYHSDGSMDYSHDLYWCDSLLYDALVTMSLAFLFIMVNWTAQLNKNAWWMWIKLALHVAGWLLQVGSGVMLLIAFFSWCTSMESAMSADDDNPPAKDDENKCLRAARYFDEDKNEESTLTHLYSFTLISLGVALLAAVLWTITLVLAIAHFCEYLYRKQDEHEDQEDDDYHLEDGDSSDEEGGYKYPPYDENLVRQRRNVTGGYNMNIQDGEEGAVGGAVGGTGLLQRDIAA